MQRREEIRRGENAPWPSPSAWSGITGRRAGILAAVLIGIAMCRPAVAAVCHVPAAVLCEGCAERLSIRVTPGGACRITFTAPASPASTATAKFVDINVEAEPARPARHRAPRLSDAKPEGPLHPQAGCFIFNGRRFCE
jgi:hypothetical protein